MLITLFLCRAQIQKLLGFSTRLGSIIFPGPKLLWKTLWHLAGLTAWQWTGSSFLCLDKPLTWPSTPYSSCFGLTELAIAILLIENLHTRSLLFVLLNNQSDRWLHPFLTGPIFWPLIMFVA